MATIEFRVKVIKSPTGTTATLAEIDGSIDATTIQQFQQVMDKLIERGVKNLILDCTSVKYINSTGLGTLLKYADTFESIGGHIAFCRVPSKVMLVMEMLGFNALFNIVPDEATALRSFSGEAAPPASVPVHQQMPPPAPAAPPPQPAYPAAPPAYAQQPAYPTAVPPPPPPAAPAAVAFPTHAHCARCRVTLEIPSVGKYRCPRCGAVLAVEPTGKVRFFASKKGTPIEVNLPTRAELLSGVGELAARCAESCGFNGDSLDRISTAVVSACERVIELAYDGDAKQNYHLLIQPNGNTLTIKISDHGKPFDFGAGGSIYGDQRFESVIGSMDTVEHRPNPRGGNLLTLIKVLE
ncbi:MAG: anti-sigma factor antagonist [Planctomycetota bacterium]|nr:anti-sigma factor antagonist [Planctomycetota bacterium]